MILDLYEEECESRNSAWQAEFVGNHADDLCLKGLGATAILLCNFGMCMLDGILEHTTHHPYAVANDLPNILNRRSTSGRCGTLVPYVTKMVGKHTLCPLATGVLVKREIADLPCATVNVEGDTYILGNTSNMIGFLAEWEKVGDEKFGKIKKFYDETREVMKGVNQGDCGSDLAPARVCDYGRSHIGSLEMVDDLDDDILEDGESAGPVDEEDTAYHGNNALEPDFGLHDEMAGIYVTVCDLYEELEVMDHWSSWWISETNENLPGKTTVATMNHLRMIALSLNNIMLYLHNEDSLRQIMALNMSGVYLMQEYLLKIVCAICGKCDVFALACLTLIGGEVV